MHPHSTIFVSTSSLSAAVTPLGEARYFRKLLGQTKKGKFGGTGGAGKGLVVTGRNIPMLLGGGVGKGLVVTGRNIPMLLSRAPGEGTVLSVSED